MAIDKSAVIYSSQITNISPNQVLNVLTMMVEEDCTVPFIARYRKEKTGGLDEVQIRNIKDAYDTHIELEKRRAYILETIKKMEALTPELEKKIHAAETLNQLEDLYAPYKAKKKTKGMMAKEAGLEPLAKIMLETKEDLAALVAKYSTQFLNPEKKINTFNDALKGACDIIIELFAHDAEIKDQLRKDYWAEAVLVSSKRDKAEEVKDYLKYKDYFEFSQKVSELTHAKAGHRFLAMRRGMTQKVLKVEVKYDTMTAVSLIDTKYALSSLGLYDILLPCAKKAVTNSIHSSLDLEIKSELKKLSDESAIEVFGVNLKNLLLQPYLGAKGVLGVDPGVRTGCKLAVVDNSGKFIVDTVIYPHPPQNDKVSSKQIVEAIIEQFNVEYVAIGNGTYGRETLEFFEEDIKAIKDGKVKATLISEAGASIYSASEIARKEFPDKDPTVRGAISIARRFQDPLAELVKIDPKSIGVGQYQHDVNQSRLMKSLASVVESCVNYVGVDLNTASPSLLSYISGIGPTVAKNIVKYREKNGALKERSELKNVSRFSEKVFQQAAGFLRIYNGSNPLDSTFIHPESYPIIEEWSNGCGVNISDLVTDSKLVDRLSRDANLKEKLGEFTLQDIVKSLKAPSQDPRTEFKSMEFRKDISKISDLTIGQWYPGVVTNITQFGAFIDIGIKENGLLHVSQIADRFIENALEALKVGEELKVRVLDVDLDRKRISLSCKSGDSASDLASASYGSSKGKNRGNNKGQTQSNGKLKNNAFAALKNFKV
jgi:uncharacterized protein